MYCLIVAYVLSVVACLWFLDGIGGIIDHPTSALASFLQSWVLDIWRDGTPPSPQNNRSLTLGERNISRCIWLSITQHCVFLCVCCRRSKVFYFLVDCLSNASVSTTATSSTPATSALSNEAFQALVEVIRTMLDAFSSEQQHLLLNSFTKYYSQCHHTSRQKLLGLDFISGQADQN